MIMANRKKLMGPELEQKPLMNVALAVALAIVLVSTVRYWTGVLG